MVAFFVSALIIYISFYCVTDMHLQDRYFLPIAALSIPLLALFFENVRFYKTGRFIAAGFLLCVTVFCFGYFQLFKDLDKNADRRDVVRYLLEEGYENGYGLFWDANVLTALSNGRIDVWVLDHESDNSFLNGIKNFDQTSHWLQLKRHDTGHPEGKVYMLFNEFDFENNPWRNEYLEQDLVYKNDTYYITGYDDYDTMKSHLFAAYEPYEYDLIDNAFLLNGEDTDKGRLVHPGGCSSGPNITLDSGEYGAIIKGSNLENAIFRSTSDSGAADVRNKEKLRTDNALEYKLYLEDETDSFETLIENETDRDVIIDSITLYKLP